jgi:hypothetical protein
MNQAASKKAHFVFIPLMAQGHVIPVIDTVLLLSTRGALCSIIATPSTAARIRPCIEQSGLEVRLLEFPLEYVSDGADNMDNLPAERMAGYFPAVALLRAPIEEYLRTQEPRVTCIVSDFCHPWSSPLAASLGVPRLSFFPMCAFCALCEHNVEKFKAFDDEDAPVVVVPVLEKRLELRREQTPRFLRHPCMGTLGKEIDRAQADVDGIIINTFFELEPDYVRGFAAAWGKKVWTVGPVSLHHQINEQTPRGEAAAIDADECMRWLDGKEAGSVVYVSFGTISPKMEPELLLELALALELSGHPFIWVLNKAEQVGESSLVLQELETRVAGHGRIVRGWVPQLLILSHEAVGCFLMHGGWNSILETITAGKPVVTWSRLALSDHHVNAKMAVDVLGIGLSIDDTTPNKEVIMAAVTSVLRGGEEGQERRSRARALSHKARAAMQRGGSSHANLCDLVYRFAT